MAASGSARAAAACMTWARPISAPSAVTIELLLMFCALNGATETPWRTSHRQIPAVTTDLPASDVVPATKNAPLTSPPRRRSSGSFAELLCPWVSWRARSRCLAPPGLLLTGQVGDGMHDPVGHEPAGAAVAGHPLLVGEGERLPEGDRDTVQPGPARTHRLHLVGPGDGDGHHRAVRGEGQPGDAGLAAGEPPVAGAGALGVDPERTAVLQHGEGGVERRLRRAVGLPLDRQRAQGAEERAAEPAGEALPGEVLGLGQVGDLAGRHRRDRDAVDERQAVAGQDHRAGQRHVLPSGGVRPEEQPEQRPDDEPGQDVEHAALLPSGPEVPGRDRQLPGHLARAFSRTGPEGPDAGPRRTRGPGAARPERRRSRGAGGARREGQLSRGAGGQASRRIARTSSGRDARPVADSVMDWATSRTLRCVWLDMCVSSSKATWSLQLVSSMRMPLACSIVARLAMAVRSWLTSVCRAVTMSSSWSSRPAVMSTQIPSTAEITSSGPGRGSPSSTMTRSEPSAPCMRVSRAKERPAVIARSIAWSVRARSSRGWHCSRTSVHGLVLSGESPSSSYISGDHHQAVVRGSRRYRPVSP